MARRLKIRAHLSLEELEERYRQAKEAEFLFQNLTTHHIQRFQRYWSMRGGGSVRRHLSNLYLM